MLGGQNVLFRQGSRRDCIWFDGSESVALQRVHAEEPLVISVWGKAFSACLWTVEIKGTEKAKNGNLGPCNSCVCNLCACVYYVERCGPRIVTGCIYERHLRVAIRVLH